MEHSIITFICFELGSGSFFLRCTILNLVIWCRTVGFRFGVLFSLFFLVDSVWHYRFRCTGYC